ncbi:MAG: radical SAM family heme chaperone HemW [Rhodothermales bacterium]
MNAKTIASSPAFGDPHMAGLYLHIPFCTQRCVYCDFYFTTTRRSHGSFVNALGTELEFYASHYADREPVETIYLGGGTPSLLSLEDLARILQTIHQHFDTDGVRETTLEMNPDDATPEYLDGLRSIGINRLSIGIQSFYPSDLEFMNRSHTPEQAEASLEYVAAAGFDTFSADLIFGIPDQPEEYWYANVQKLVRLGVPHISTYSLTVEERTPLYKMVERGLVHPAPDEELEARYRFTMEFLREHGYEHYEVSSFAKPNARSQHNQIYWNHSNYLGFGPSAHSFWWTGLPAERWFNEANLRRYEALLQQHNVPIGGKEAMSLDMLANEYILLRLRTSDGLDLDYLETKYGVDLLYEKEPALADLEDEGYIDAMGDRHVRLTDSGMLLCDAITTRLLLD